MEAILSRGRWVDIDSDNGFVLPGIKPLPELKLTRLYDAICDTSQRWVKLDIIS